MKALAVLGSAFGALALGALAAGLLTVVTPAPVMSIEPGRPHARAKLAAIDDTVAVPAPSRPLLETPTTTADSLLSDVAPASTKPPTDPKPPAKPPAPRAAKAPKPALAASLLTPKPSAPIIAAVKHRLAKTVALVLPPRPSPAAKTVQPVDHRYDGVLTISQIGQLKAALRLSSDQQAYWPAVAEMLKMVARRQMAAVKSGEAPSFGTSGDLMQFYFAAQPLLRSLRDDQKAEVRRLARRMGFGSVDAYI